MAAAGSGPLLPVALRREGDDRLIIDWNDGHQAVYTWQHLRKHCPCAGCREENPRWYRATSRRFETILSVRTAAMIRCARAKSDCGIRRYALRGDES